MSDVALAEAVRAGDPDRFWPTMAAPAALRDLLWPVYAVNLQIARAPWASDQPLLAEMRLQWWIDGLAAPPQGDAPADLRALWSRGAPVAAALHGVAQARRGDCWAEPFADARDLMDYLDQTAGNVAWAAGLSLGAGPADQAALRAHGRAQGLASYLRAAAALARRGRNRLVSLSAGNLADLAQQALAERRSARLPAPLRAAAFPGALAVPILSQAARDPALIEAGGLSLSEFRRRAILARLALTGRP
ncbi:squalene/phytoene synthase family protein [Paracoccus sp. p4-l81]|uniref:squalene/phytoene synthase family protein n=1 Tax=Paracoccus sp. p4-l81 TaxID=3342806 RepID=UPI0035B931F9